MKKTALLVFLLAFPALASASEISEAYPSAEEVTVTGKKGDILQQVTGRESELLNPSQMSVYKAINLMPSLSQQSVDPYGLADIVNYHESFRFRGVEATSGGVPATTVNVEGLPVTGRPGGGATIYDLENFSNINIYTGVMPASAGLGLADVGGKINMEIRRPEESFGVLFKQGFGSNDFRRTFLRVDTGALPGDVKSFISFSDAAADKWKGEGDSQRRNVMAGVTKTFGDNVKLEAFVTYSKGDIHAYRPFSYAQIGNLESAYTIDYGTNPDSYDYYGYNRNEFEDWMVMANLEVKTGEHSKLDIKPYYWSDKGYYLETITLANNQNRIRRWDIDHDLKGVLAEYTTTIGSVDLDFGYLYHTQVRPGPPTSWKNYKVVNGKPVFDQWNILSNSSSHELHSPFLEATYRFGSWKLEGGLKYINYTLPSIITYNTAGLGDLSYDEALAGNPSINAKASALDTKSFSRLFPNLTLTRFIGDNISLHAAYGENYVTHVDIYPYFISQSANFIQKGISFQQLWDAREMETSQNFELGMRVKGSNWSIAPTIYYALHNNKQAVLYDPVLDATYPMNNADAEGYGFELEAEYKPLENLSCYGSFSWNRFSFSQDINSDAPGGGIIKVKGEQVPDAPEFLAKGMVSYKAGDFLITPIVRYTSVRYGDVLHNEKIDSTTLFDLDLTWQKKMLGFKEVEISLSLLNIFDKQYVSMISTSDYKTLKTSYQAGMPFTVMATLAVHY
ncbi:TonB-dependent receptor [Chlorobium phaeobacteroides]|uniref:TonB-dependent receptor, putative n=1 Tax=Chlorobium phaeobacteroides (strain DSM 266 / SMG 266 / 2430) TaxID=290317 RepID=A1BDM1_CHLPD|nr:TonB-dependent receptor [Chlorobium phaeobacteroides]ABL64498.1 TonB-dependent receptor, putative [Chlorobium phaeobacteroides DSM 266]